MNPKRFRVALSFPGEKREFVGRVAAQLSTRLGKEQILYDEYLMAELARPDLDLYLASLYHNDSELLVPFYCADYEQKQWCKLEWRQMRDILFQMEGNRLMPFRFDDSPISGVLSVDGYVKIDTRTPVEVAELILERINGCRSSAVPAIRIAPSRLRHGAETLVGREDDLAMIDKAWSDPKVHILSIIAWGGVGKTSLVVEWMGRKSAAGWNGFKRVFDWSFYSQGFREQGATSADVFVASALEFFGDSGLARGNAPPWEKGARLAELVAEEPSLLVLDGIESLQYAPGSADLVSGKLKDPALEALVKGLVRKNPGLCLVTSCAAIAELNPFRDNVARV